MRAGVPARVARLLAGEMAEELPWLGNVFLPEQLASEGFLSVSRPSPTR